MPPDVDDLTDEEQFDDDNLGTPVVSDVAGTLEITMPDDNDNPIISDKKKENNSRKRKRESIVWTNESPAYTFGNLENLSKRNSDILTAQTNNMSPVELFEEFFTESVYDMIVEETNRYAHEMKNKLNYNVTKDEIKTFIGFLILSGYHTLPSERDYWAEADDLGVTIVKNAMTRNFYLELKRLLHFQDNKLHQYNKNDKSFKIRPLLEMLSKNFQKWGIFHENLSVDEMIVRYYGHHTLKQFIKSKPIRFGYKLWALCGNDGYCYNFALYCGKETNTSESDKLPLGTKVVLNLLSIVEDPKSHRVYFDNFFTSHALLKKLKELKFRASGTIRENRTEKCPIMDDKKMSKKERGFYDSKFDTTNEILVVKWKDNKCVSLATNFDTIMPLSSVQRWSVEKKEKVKVNQPHAISSYTSFMGGVDLHDWLLEKHSIAIRGKKWYFCLITRMIDMAVVNAYLIYKRIHRSMSIKDFRRYIAVTYLKKGADSKAILGRPVQRRITCRSNVLPDIKFDKIQHVIVSSAVKTEEAWCKLLPSTWSPITNAVPT
ncbi:PiggyBac transposable element-derived protein 2, partial [Stegodyphus mimosarum]